MLDHHIQRTILYSLAYTDGLRFSDLKPEDIENKLFDYHLKKVLVAGYAEKSSDGLYRMTSEGKRIWKSLLKKQADFIDRAYSILFLVVRRSDDGAWLLYRRKAQPFLNMMGLMQAQPSPHEEIAKTSASTLLANTGLSGTFSPISSGYLRIFDGDTLESFTHYTLLVTEDVAGELIQNDEFGEYEWVMNPDFSTPDFLPTVSTLIQAYQDKQTGIIEKTFTL